MFALIDCNNFYASCERLFRPDLKHEPVIVLSNNDGCIIARSNEAKALGIKMGEPYFKVRALCKEHRVNVFSSNYTLYGDLSHRVMCTIEDAWPAVEIYSIDEAFLDLSSMPRNMHQTFCLALQKRVLKNTGIPTSIGIGKTKTLAKIANHIAKKQLKIPVFNLCHQEEWLSNIAVGDVWGVGRQWQARLVAKGIHTAADLQQTNPQVIKKNFNIALMRTTLELNGTPCTTLLAPCKKQSIMSSKSFGALQTEYRVLAEAVSHHCARVYEKLRQEKLLARHLSVFVHSHRFRDDLPQYHQSIDFKLIHATDDLCALTRITKFCLKKIYRPGIHYQKVGVLVSDLVDKGFHQIDLFHQPSNEALLKIEQKMTLIDNINQKFGRHSLFLAAAGCSQPWSMKQVLKSPNYTTAWRELPVVTIRST